MDKIIFVGAHPDDFIGCSGTALRLKDYYEEYIWDFTKGERGLLDQGISMEECTKIRMKEEQTVADMVGAKLEFLGEIDGDAYATRERCAYIAERLKELKPRAVFTHFIPDHHGDHIMTTAAILKAIMLAGINPEIYYYEFNHSPMGYIPDIYVNITSVIEEKKKIIRAYPSQNPDDSMLNRKIPIDEFRGLQNWCGYAETFKSHRFPRAGVSTIFDCLK